MKILETAGGWESTTEAWVALLYAGCKNFDNDGCL